MTSVSAARGDAEAVASVQDAGRPVGLLMRIIGPDRAFHSSEAVAGAERELRFRSHEIREGQIGRRRKRSDKVDAYVRRMRARGMIAAVVGVYVALGGLATFAALVYYRIAQAAAFGAEAELIVFIGILVAPAAALMGGLLAAGGFAFRAAREWGRRAVVFFLKAALAAWIAVSIIGPAYMLGGDSSGDSKALAWFSWGVALAVAIFLFVEIRRFGSQPAKAWCIVRLKGHRGRTAAALSAIDP